MEESVTVNKSQRLMLRCRTRGNPMPNVAWFKDGKPLGPNNKRIRIKTKRSVCNTSTSNSNRLTTVFFVLIELNLDVVRRWRSNAPKKKMPDSTNVGRQTRSAPVHLHEPKSASSKSPVRPPIRRPKWRTAAWGQPTVPLKAPNTFELGKDFWVILSFSGGKGEDFVLGGVLEWSLWDGRERERENDHANQTRETIRNQEEESRHGKEGMQVFCYFWGAQAKAAADVLTSALGSF